MTKLENIQVSIDCRSWINMKTLRVEVRTLGKIHKFEEDFREDDFECRFDQMMDMAKREIKAAVNRSTTTNQQQP